MTTGQAAFHDGQARVAVYARLDALAELLGRAWYAVLGSNYSIAALEFLARYGDPHAVIRLGRARLTRFLIARSRGATITPPGSSPRPERPSPYGAPATGPTIWTSPSSLRTSPAKPNRHCS